MRFGETEIAKEEFYAAKKPVNIWDVNIDNIVISKLIKTKKNSKYLIEHLNKIIRPLVLIMPKVGGYVKTFIVKDEDKHRNKELMFFRIYDEKLLEKHKTIWTKVEDLKILNKTLILLFYACIKCLNVYTNHRGLNVPEDDIECESFTVIFLDSLLVYENKYYLKDI